MYRFGSRYNKFPTEYLPGKSFNLKKISNIFQRNNLFNFRGVLCLQATSSDVLRHLVVRIFSQLNKLGKENFSNHLVIFDGKRGDIGNTQSITPLNLLRDMRPTQATVSPYMGLKALCLFWEKPGKNGIYVLCKTSNTGSDVIQNVLVSKNSKQKAILPLYEYIAEIFVEFDVRESNRSRGRR
ncbi:MAG: hypothetical protein CM15mP58_02010 [Burkholderiaceae bacterium]|nr:MAG: hypothetical protein CM15mP58_02010 [Burkholderiaceae bacterium]